MLRGPRVVLRPFEREDVKRLHALKANVDLVISGWGAWAPTPLVTEEKQFDQRAEELSRWQFAIETEGTFLGFVSLHPWSIDQRAQSAALAIAIVHPEYVGKGYGYEVMTLFLDWVFRVQNFRRVELIVWPTNERACRLYTRLGFVEEGRSREAVYVNGSYSDLLHMGLLRREWEARQASQAQQAAQATHPTGTNA